ncbi:tol-pal system protein YbgF [Pelagibaculum spongiae]|uniref:Cell division coordinator CpoB n=1 Tax=Pelagibaculum spongiae TaxID=2080658 RepID=A0A2V1H181_9GAMM|nr:tol-pal system protein YbgF [Pelagibaculum spongiae]PVZ69440.1 tol-pal system protein YbgF [Pelagibaculum spongiae]
MNRALLPLVLLVASSSLLAQQNYPTPPSGKGFPIYPDGKVIQSGSQSSANRTEVTPPVQAAVPVRQPVVVLTLEDRIGNVERQLQARGQLDLLRQVSAIRNEVSQLQGALDEQQYKVQRLEQRQRDLFKDLDQRLTQLRGQVSGGHVATSSGTLSPVEIPSTAVSPLAPIANPIATIVSPSVAATGDRAAYDKAYQLVNDGKYGEALSALDSYLQQFPLGEFRANAYYWQGQIFYLNRQLSEAEVAYQSVLTQHADHPKAADSMLKLAIVKIDLKQTDQAAKLFNQVVARYPESSAARLAKQHLRKLPR